MVNKSTPVTVGAHFMIMLEKSQGELVAMVVDQPLSLINNPYDELKEVPFGYKAV